MLSISHIRNIESLSLEFGPHFNILYGDNGAGKSAILEAIYLLSTGKSFRTNQLRKIISYSESEFTLFAKVKGNDGSHYQLGLSKSLQGNEMRINGEKVKNIAEFASKLPVLVITQDSHKLLDSGPQWRRQFLDWGLFHVKHEFLSVWQNYRKILKQRNAALQKNCSVDEVKIWDEALAEYGEQYHRLRTTLLSDFLPYFIEFSRHLLGEKEYNVEYVKGWPKGLNFGECLPKYYSRDLSLKRTDYGPHRADFKVFMNGQNCRDSASRGQQKLLVHALNFALVSYLEACKGAKTTLLLDDLGSELDPRHTKKLLRLLEEKFSQVCITTANLDSLPLANSTDIKMFHVEHGEVTKVFN